jgi:hypothetical protein
LWATASSLVVAIATIVPARAQWNVRVDGPDVFGASTVVAVVDGDSRNGLVVQCNSEDSLALAYILPGTASELDSMSKSSI